MDKNFWNREIETLPREGILEQQLADLKKITKYAYAQSPYYKRLYDEAGVNPSCIEKLDDIENFSFINKTALRADLANAPIYGDILAVPENEIVYIACSSGTTGQPTISPFTKDEFKQIVDLSARFFYSFGMREADRYIHCLNLSLFIASPSILAAQDVGAASIWGGILPKERLFKMLQKLDVTMMQTTPSFAWQMGNYVKDLGIDPAKDLSINKLIVAGEPGGSIPSTRQAIEQIWGVKLFEVYGFSDIAGCLAASCPAQDGLHLAEDYFMVEVISLDTGKPVLDGETGELVFTALKKRGRPMIRYRSGDVGSVNHSTCSCGRTHARLKVVGRLDDMFIISGVNVFPSDIEPVIRNLDGITSEYRIRLISEDFTTRYVIEVERDRNSYENIQTLKDRVSNTLKNTILARPMDVVVLHEGDLPRTGYKTKRIIDERNNQ